MKTIDLKDQNAVAQRSKATYGISANGKSTPSILETWTLHARVVSPKDEVSPGKKLASATLRRRTNKWSPLAMSGRLGEVAKLLAVMR